MRLRLPGALRARLLVLLLAAISLAVLVQAAIAYRTARTEADEIFDYHMQQMALSLRPGLPIDGTLAPDGGSSGTPPPDEENFEFVVQIWSAEGLRIYQSAARAALPQHAVLGFSNTTARGATYRVFSMQSPTQVIQVAQDMAVRRAMARRMALRILWPIPVMAAVLMLLVWWVVGASLAPVTRIQRELARRQADDLGAVPDRDLPDEIRPLVIELNQLFSRLRLAFDAQQNFVADAAHELRTPLAALKLQFDGVRRSTDDSARARALARLGEGIDRAARLVEQLLQLARQQAALTDRRRPEPVCLAALVRAAVAEAAADAHARAIDLGVAQADEDELPGHAEALAILLRNLIGNAVKYTPEHGTVDVSVVRDGDALVLRVEDSGPGIAPADRARASDRFFRAADAAAMGSGLGLSIVRSIAELHGAALSLGTSRRLGGLQVELRLPAV